MVEDSLSGGPCAREGPVYRITVPRTCFFSILPAENREKEKLRKIIKEKKTETKTSGGARGPQNPSPAEWWRRRRRWRTAEEEEGLLRRRRRSSRTRGMSSSRRGATSRPPRSTRRPSSSTPTTPPSTGSFRCPPLLFRLGRAGGRNPSCACARPAFGGSDGELRRGCVRYAWGGRRRTAHPRRVRDH